MAQPLHPDGQEALLRRSLRHYRRSAAWQPLEYLFWCLPVLAWFAFPGHYLLLSQMAVMGLFALSLDLIFGYAGIISLGHAAFFGVGAYTAGLLAQQGMGSPLPGLLAAMAVAGVAGFASSFLLLRGGDLARLMVTLGVALMLHELANRFSRITGGVDGLPGLEIAPVLGMFEFDLFGRTAYLYALAVLALLFWLARRLVHSPFGLGLRGVRMNARRMAALGAPVQRRLVAIYTVGAVYAGAAGALLVQTNQYVSLSVLGLENSADVLLMLILGGAGHLYGGLIGAVLFLLARQLLSGVDPQFWEFWLGLALVLLVLFARGGVLGLAARWRRGGRSS